MSWRELQARRYWRELRLWRKNGDGVGLEQRVIDAQRRHYRKVIELKDIRITALEAAVELMRRQRG